MEDRGVCWQFLLLAQVHRMGTFEPCQAFGSWCKACEKKGKRNQGSQSQMHVKKQELNKVV